MNKIKVEIEIYIKFKPKKIFLKNNEYAEMVARPNLGFGVLRNVRVQVSLLV